MRLMISIMRRGDAYKVDDSGLACEDCFVVCV